MAEETETSRIGSQLDLSAIGVFYDRSGAKGQPVACGFSAGEKLVVAAATSLMPYASTPRMLRVHFPYANRSLCAEDITFHHLFDKANVERLMQQGLLLSSPKISAVDYNCCVVRLTEQTPALYETDLNDVQAAWHFPLNLEKNDLRGSLKDLELPLVIQTLSNARKQGVLYLFDDQSRPVAQIFCAEGKVVSARFGILNGAPALYQILEKRVVTDFEFYPAERGEYWPQNLTGGSADMLLIEGMRRLDEIEQLRENYQISDFTYVAKQMVQCNLEALSQELQTIAINIWDVLDGCTPIGELWWTSHTDDFLIYRTICELFASKQIVAVDGSNSSIKLPEKIQRLAVGILDISNSQRCPKPDSLIESFSLDTKDSFIRTRTGVIVGDSPTNWFHNIKLAPAALGTPLIANGKVIGMHLGQTIETNASQPTYKMVPCSILSSMLPGSNVITNSLRFEPAGRIISKPAKKRSKSSGDWKMTLIWFVIGFIIVIGIKFVSSFVSP
jgi:hypothetical protein